MIDSELVIIRPDGSEYRICSCGDHYELPIPYAQANPEIRDKCPECVSVMQRKREEQ
jgi:hypothetical protein